MADYDVAVSDGTNEEMFEQWGGDNTIGQLVEAAQEEGVGSALDREKMGIQFDNGTSSDKAIHQFSDISGHAIEDHCNETGTIVKLQGETKVGA